MGIMAAVVIPRLFTRKDRPIEMLVEQIAQLTTMGYERAIITGKRHRLFFEIADTSSVSLQVEHVNPASKEQKFLAVNDSYMQDSYRWDNRCFIPNFYIKAIDEAGHKSLKTAWFFIQPQGTAQEVIINIKDEETGDERGMVLNPFTVHFTVYETFQSP